MKRKVLLLLFPLMFLFMMFQIAVKANPVLDSMKVAKNISFLSKQNDNIIANGLTISFISPSPSLLSGDWGELYYSFNETSYIGKNTLVTSSTVASDGITVEFKNNSTEIFIIKWSESAFSGASFSGIPFVSGMKYVDAGNPSATPDTIVPPGQAIQKAIYSSNVKYDNYWKIRGEPLPREGGITFNLVLKIVKQDNSAQYVTLTTPMIGIPEDPSSI